MLQRSKLLLAGIIAALVLGTLVDAAPANRLSLSGQQWRAVWGNLRFLSAFASLECHVTLEGSFHSRTLSKVLEQLIGYVSKATIDETHCTGGSARALTEMLPWHVRYNGFSGSLPEINELHLRVVNFAFLIQVNGTSCLYRSTASSPLRGWIHLVESGIRPLRVAERLRIDETASIPLSSGGFLCSSAFRWGGTSNQLTEGPTTTKITITLVQ